MGQLVCSDMTTNNLFSLNDDDYKHNWFKKKNIENNIINPTVQRRCVYINHCPNY